MNTDVKTLAYINMYAILARIPDVCALVPEAKALLPKAPVSVCLKVKDGPAMTLRFEDGGCEAVPAEVAADVKLPFSSCEKFNGLLTGTTTPIPSKGFTKIKFLTGPFTKLTDILSEYLRPTPEKLEDETFFNTSTTLMLYVVAGAVSQIGNHDKIGKFSASNTVDGAVVLSVKDGPAAAIVVKSNKLETVRSIPEKPTAIMEFQNMRLARQLFDGKVNALACIGEGKIVTRGNMSQLDNINRILDRVALYLA